MTTFTTPLNQVESLYVGYFGRTNTNIEAGDVVALVGSVNMSVTDYASIGANHFRVIAA